MDVIKTNFKYTKPLIPLQLSDVRYIILHHAQAITATPEEIHSWHLDNSWAGFGYNEYIRKNGVVYIGRGDNIGAQCSGMNSTSYGICCEGNYDVERVMPAVQLNSLVERIVANMARFPNYKCVAPHSQFFSTDCPGQFFPMAAVLKNVEDLRAFNRTISCVKIISSPDYWIQNAISGRHIKGSWMHQIILNFVAMFENVSCFENAVGYLYRKNIISTPSYWIQNAIDGGNIDGWYARKVLMNMGRKL